VFFKSTSTAVRTTLICSPWGFDNIGDVLKKMGQGFEHEKIGWGEIKSLEAPAVHRAWHRPAPGLVSSRRPAPAARQAASSQKVPVRLRLGALSGVWESLGFRRALFDRGSANGRPPAFEAGYEGSSPSPRTLFVMGVSQRTPIRGQLLLVVQVQLLPGALQYNLARWSIGRTRAPQARKAGSTPARVTMAKWRNWTTHDAQNVGPSWAWEFYSPLGHSQIAGGQVPN
jgi:hypothetical protein